PASTIGVRGGITVVTITANRTVANFVFGTSMTVTGGGKTVTCTRQGSQVSTNAGAMPGAPTITKAGDMNGAMGQLEGTSSGSGGSSSSSSGPGGKSPDQALQGSGLTSQNSGQTTVTLTFNNQGSTGAPPNPNNNALTNAVNNSNPASNPADGG